ncbi:PREDICTED: thyrotropin-releasing hormone receptor [Dinoponera quadriceps]|uniref:Thyrotropin-releasing hormone receptor n=1 Tax=Dinoponera quadriceps TaxID=609295 RepID=A0A6P3Y5Q0_DINQU|nr:PREDICTED: thyrotropin-releasing hormone receptor [Dinoponera quadriceps]XP_014486285.1 PREDICTED: thyrotropin-releasing hormone receptor [Dinoponera quadriceps]XP_014486286.1 PREDICTED: thyrotropin-releasing hormone receptor [Dinoponera quadriceps]XP_014486287.1 PREDICTED: thyrotropin-releasing hormone receptor [Dinoponera quadriceps]XP_014486288.1 PREDICTED: thyrotropin-releasing hormone receptor [Dinoponera quadriceps]XP_014486290.1 PREDICTED: thyrotropin-releasing hormone receptor [Dino
MPVRNMSTTEVVLHNIQVYYTPILVHLGLLGNILSVCVFFGTKLRRASSSIYLGALAISDSGFLVMVCLVWLNEFNIHLFNESGYCQSIVYVSAVCSFLSVWLVVAFTVERYVAVKYPLRRQSLCTIARAKVVIIGLTVLAILLSGPFLLFSGPRKVPTRYGNTTLCYLATGWESWANAYNYVDTVLTFAVPLTMIVIFNTLIARNIYKHDHVRRTLTIESDVSNEKDARNARDRMPQTKVTKMLLIVSSAFLCLNMPSFVLRMFAFYDQSQKYWLISAQQMCNILFNTSFGINFILYCASGQNFRKEMVRMFIHRPRVGRNGTLIQMANQGKQYVSDFTRRWSSTKRSSVDNVQRQDSQETRKLPISEKL